MQPPSSINTPQIVGWLLTAAAFAGTMYWNFANRRHTNRIANDIRREKFEQDVWERHRARIDSRLEELTSFVSNLPGQILAMPPGINHEPQLEIWGLNLSLLHDSLARALAEADQSIHCNGDDWEIAAQGATHGTEKSWDIVLSLFGQASSENDIKVSIKHLRSMNSYTLEIERLIRRKMQAADYHYEPK